jgi:hypothetical protein
MVTLTHAYTSAKDAETAVERLLSADVSAVRLQLIMGRAIQDARDTPIGTFAGTATADSHTVGSYGNVARSGRGSTGTFAGDPRKQRRGSFGDSDRDTVTTYQSGAKRTRIASHRRLKRLLVDAGLEPAIATANVDALHAGRVLVLVQGESALNDVQQTLRAAA